MHIDDKTEKSFKSLCDAHNGHQDAGKGTLSVSRAFGLRMVEEYTG